MILVNNHIPYDKGHLKEIELLTRAQQKSSKWFKEMFQELQLLLHLNYISDIFT